MSTPVVVLLTAAWGIANLAIIWTAAGVVVNVEPGTRSLYIMLLMIAFCLLNAGALKVSENYIGW